jgi:TRAP-type C4-dicarboxylate transport system permease small subunit
MNALAQVSIKLARCFGLVSAATLFAIMMLMVADVVGRYIFNAPILGAYEITEFMMCVMIFSAMPLVSLFGRHVEASLIADVLPRLGPLLLWIATVISIVVFGYLAMRLWVYGGQLARQNSHSLFGGIPHAPFAYFVAVMFVLTAAASLIGRLQPTPSPYHTDLPED